MSELEFKALRVAVEQVLCFPTITAPPHSLQLLRMNYTWQEYFQVITARMDDERFLWRLQLGELDRNVDSGPLLAQLHERVGVMERERLEGLEKMNALTASLRSAEERVRCLQDETERLQVRSSIKGHKRSS